LANQKQELPVEAMFVNRSEPNEPSLYIAHFVVIRYQTWPPQAILFSDWSISKKYFPLQPLGQMNRILVGGIL
jgi:hypothetical protein